MKEQYYCVAGLNFCLQGELPENSYLDNYLPFKLQERKEPLLFTLRLDTLQQPKGKPTISYMLDDIDYTIYLQDGTCDIFLKPDGATKEFHMHASKQWSDVIADIDFSTPDDMHLLNNFMMFAYIYSAAYL